MKAVITGGAGFIGRRLAERLRSSGHTPIIADLKCATDQNSSDHRVDVLDLSETRNTISGADVVYHLAGPVLETARKDPFWSAQLQLAGTLNVLEACRHEAVGKIVLASSFYVYDGLPAQGIVNENSTLDPGKMELFGSLKVAAEQLVLGYARRFGLKFVILRFGSVYGWGEGSNLVQTLLKAGLGGQTLEIWGAGNRANQYTYVEDIAEGCVQALASENETYNLISPEETTTGGLADRMCEMFGFRKQLYLDRPEGTNFPYMSSRKAGQHLEWTSTPLTEALEALVRAASERAATSLVRT